MDMKEGSSKLRYSAIKGSKNRWAVEMTEEMSLKDFHIELSKNAKTHNKIFNMTAHNGQVASMKLEYNGDMQKYKESVWERNVLSAVLWYDKGNIDPLLIGVDIQLGDRFPNGIGFNHTSVMKGDCTSTFDVVLDKEYTLKEMLIELKETSRLGWGRIFVYTGEEETEPTIIEYTDKSLSIPPHMPIYDKIVTLATGKGGWSGIDFTVMLKDKEES